jgi:enolase
MFAAGFRYQGAGVLTVVKNVNEILAPAMLVRKENHFLPKAMCPTLTSQQHSI